MAHAAHAEQHEAWQANRLLAQQMPGSPDMPCWRFHVGQSVCCPPSNSSPTRYQIRIKDDDSGSGAGGSGAAGGKAAGSQGVLVGS